MSEQLNFENFESKSEQEIVLLNDNSEMDDEFEDAFVAEKIIIPEQLSTDDRSKIKGVKIFCFILALCLFATCFSVGGYFVGRQSLNQYDKLDSQFPLLEDRPDNDNILSTDRIYSDTVNSVVGILVYNEYGSDTSEATGVVYSENGYIITNDHIYSSIPSAKFKIFFHDGTEYDAYFVAGDTRSDLAVLKINSDVKFKVPVFGDSNKIKVGETVCAVGCPNGYNSDATITRGIISSASVRRSITTNYSSRFIQTDTAINPGNSGGALLNLYGQVVGITSAKIADAKYEGVGYAIPTTIVKQIAQSLIENGNVKDRARLGITYQFYSDLSAKHDEPNVSGLLISEVSTDSDLFGKVNKGDIIIGIDNYQITHSDVVLDVLDSHQPGDKIKLSVYKTNGQEEIITAVLLSDEGSSSYTIASGIKK